MILLFLGSWRSTLIVARLDPAVDPGVDHRALRARADAQRDDARRPGARGRHPRRRRDGRDREHPPQPRPWASRCARRSSTARSRSPCRRSSRRCRSASCSSRSCSSTGPAKYLFTPLALAVVFAMLASYLLSRTLVPTMVALPAARAKSHAHGAARRPTASSAASHGAFERGFERFRDALRAACSPGRSSTAAPCSPRSRVVRRRLAGAAARSSAATSSRRSTPASSGCTCARPPGTRIEETEQLLRRGRGRRSARSIPADEIELMLDNIGLPNRSINLAFSDSATIGTADGEILVALKHERTGRRARLRRRRCARELPQQFPELTFFFQPADIVSQILNFGLPAPIDIQVAGLDREGRTYEIARADRATRIAADSRRRGRAPAPGRRRARAARRRRSHAARAARADAARRRERACWSRCLGSGAGRAELLARSRRTASATSSRCRRRSTASTRVDALDASPVVVAGRRRAAAAGATSRTIERGVDAGDRQPLQRAAGVRRLRQRAGHATSAASRATIDQHRRRDRSRQLPRGHHDHDARPGREHASRRSCGSGCGLVFAVVLVYLLMVVNFQCWLDPFIILMALPGALAGIVWMLFVTQTTFSVPALMGAIMCDRRRDREQHPAGHLRQRAAARRARTRSTRRSTPAARACGRC